MFVNCLQHVQLVFMTRQPSQELTRLGANTMDLVRPSPPYPNLNDADINDGEERRFGRIAGLYGDPLMTVFPSVFA
jgi:hypothetical protein